MANLIHSRPVQSERGGGQTTVITNSLCDDPCVYVFLSVYSPRCFVTLEVTFNMNRPTKMTVILGSILTCIFEINTCLRFVLYWYDVLRYYLLKKCNSLGNILPCSSRFGITWNDEEYLFNHTMLTCSWHHISLINTANILATFDDPLMLNKQHDFQTSLQIHSDAFSAFKHPD